MMTVLIPRGTAKPAKKSNIFTTYADNQSAVTIKVYEGERARTRDNNLLGSFDLTGIPPAPRGVPQIEVTFSVDANGIMTIEAKDKATGNTKNLRIENPDGKHTDDEIRRMIDDAEKFKEEDNKYREKIEEYNKFEQTLLGAKKLVNEHQSISQETKDSANKLINTNLEWLESNKGCEKSTLQSKLKDFESQFQAIIQGAQASSNPSNTAGPRVEEVDD